LLLSASGDFKLQEIGRTHVRLALLNATEQAYAVRNGSGIGVGAPQFGTRSALYVGVAKDF
jgi:hypothetical protein